jgi:membrane-associated phospholipid phosphatase
MKPHRLKRIFALVVSPFFFFMSSPVHAENQDITEAGDYLQIILPAVAGVSTLFAGNPEGGWVDREGLYQFTKSLTASLVTMGVGKEVSKKLRPDGSDRASHPSGHTTAAFAGAGFIDQRYGHAWGIPALVAAGFVGYSRVQSANHFMDDVTAGASIGLL